ncbi:MAG: single-stranded DNA-binding protein, partial [Thermosynechococcaceae cyanobacterium MS004]|nr:single-stranded DNA-binding protein [Thermosynechococcaceae cyanobacterium MS004]
MNSANLIGRLTADPEIRYLESGAAVAKFNLAVGRTKEETDFLEVEAWEKVAEVVAQYCKKGSLIGVSGSLRQERWKDKTTGTGRSKVVIRCSRIELLGARPDGESQGTAVPSSVPQPAYAAQ